MRRWCENDADAKLNPKMIWCWICLERIPNWPQNDAKTIEMIPQTCRKDTKREPTWYQHSRKWYENDFKMMPRNAAKVIPKYLKSIPRWFQNGAKRVPTRCQSDARMMPRSFLNMISKQFQNNSKAIPNRSQIDPWLIPSQSQIYPKSMTCHWYMTCHGSTTCHWSMTCHGSM